LAVSNMHIAVNIMSIAVYFCVMNCPPVLWVARMASEIWQLRGMVIPVAWAILKAMKSSERAKFQSQWLKATVDKKLPLQPQRG
jgi:hypothetical protein